MTELPRGMTAYHIFLDGTYPSYVDRSIKLVNENLTVCLDFNSDWINPKPVVCHPIKESEIRLKNDSVVDAGFFVASNSLNTSNANICVPVYALTDTEKEAGVASDAQGRPCTFGLYHDQCLKQFIQELNKPIDDWMAAVPKDNNTFNDTPGYGTRTLPTGDACYDAGLDDGKHGAFEPYTFGDYCGPTSPEHHTENRYYKGFIDGLGH